MVVGRRRRLSGGWRVSEIHAHYSTRYPPLFHFHQRAWSFVGASSNLWRHHGILFFLYVQVEKLSIAVMMMIR